MSQSFSKWFKTGAFRRGLRDPVAGDEGQRVQRIGRLPTRRQRVFETEIDFRKRKNEYGRDLFMPL
jgi:hypothetical protein